MSENRRQLLKDAMDNKETYRIPMGFWHHFVLGKDQFRDWSVRSFWTRS